MAFYSGRNILPSHDIHYSWTGWPSGEARFPTTPPPDFFGSLAEAYTLDGLELESRSWSPERIQLTFRAGPSIAPIQVSQRAKGRLDHALRSSPADTAVSFSRKVAVRAIGHNRNAVVDAYIRDQLEHADLADPSYRELLASVAVNNPALDLSEAAHSSHGRYWYNLHLVFVVTGRYRVGNPAFLEQLRERIMEICKREDCALKRAAIMPDHLHVALRGNPRKSPTAIALSLQAATAEVARCRIWEEDFYVGTFGTYDCDAVPGSGGGVRRG
jgi:REP element-mobilizing transposase RayT